MKGITPIAKERGKVKKEIGKSMIERFKSLFFEPDQVHVHLNTEDMELIGSEEFQTESGKGIREIYKKAKYTLEVTSRPPGSKEEE